MVNFCTPNNVHQSIWSTENAHGSYRKDGVFSKDANFDSVALHLLLLGKIGRPNWLKLLSIVIR